MDKRKFAQQDRSPLSKAVVFHAQLLANHEAYGLVFPRTPQNSVIGFSFRGKVANVIKSKIKNYMYTLILKLEAAGMRVSYLIREGFAAQPIRK